MDEEMEMAIAMSQAEAQQPRQVPQVKILKISNMLHKLLLHNDIKKNMWRYYTLYLNIH